MSKKTYTVTMSAIGSYFEAEIQAASITEARDLALDPDTDWTFVLGEPEGDIDDISVEVED